MELRRGMPRMSWVTAFGALVVLTSSMATAQSADPFQRYIVFHNSFVSMTIYPVIQSPNGPATTAARAA